jgi:hypothetical protein
MHYVAVFFLVSKDARQSATCFIAALRSVPRSSKASDAPSDADTSENISALNPRPQRLGRKEKLNDGTIRFG